MGKIEKGGNKILGKREIYVEKGSLWPLTIVLMLFAVYVLMPKDTKEETLKLFYSAEEVYQVFETKKMVFQEVAKTLDNERFWEAIQYTKGKDPAIRYDSITALMKKTEKAGIDSGEAWEAIQRFIEETGAIQLTQSENWTAPAYIKYTFRTKAEEKLGLVLIYYTKEDVNQQTGTSAPKFRGRGEELIQLDNNWYFGEKMD